MVLVWRFRGGDIYYVLFVFVFALHAHGLPQVGRLLTWNTSLLLLCMMALSCTCFPLDVYLQSSLSTRSSAACITLALTSGDTCHHTSIYSINVLPKHSKSVTYTSTHFSSGHPITNKETWSERDFLRTSGARSLLSSVCRMMSLPIFLLISACSSYCSFSYYCLL